MTREATWPISPAPALSVVLPVNNEKESLAILLEELTATLRPLGRTFEILAIDDGSTDGSEGILNEQSALIRELKVIRMAERKGQGSALQRGFDEARATVIVSLDADLENDPRDIPRVLRALEESRADVVCGWRQGEGRPALKRLGSYLANGLRRAVFGEPIHDVGCTLRAYRREALARIRIEGAGHRMLTARLHLAGLRLVEVPVAYRPRRFGVSKYGTFDRLHESSWEFLRLAFAAWRRKGAQ